MKDLALCFAELDVCLVNLFVVALKGASCYFLGVVVALFVLYD